MKRRVHWPIVLGWCVVWAIIGVVVFAKTRSIWTAVGIVVLVALGILVNGLFAEWEDNQPGGFHNPSKKKP